MALTDFFEPFVKLNPTSVPDGFGGVKQPLVDGETFQAGIGAERSTEMKIAEQNGLKTVYAIVTGTETVLNHGDVVKRLSDGKRFKVTSNSADMTTPSVAEVQFAQVSAEEVDV